MVDKICLNFSYMNICIIIPSYNLGDKLKKCLEAVIKTNYKKIQILIIDNGSSPSLKSILGKYRKKISNLFFLRNENNLGFARSMNLGLSYARQKIKNIDYFLLLNNDAYIKKNFFIVSLRFLKDKHPDLMSPIVILTNNRGVDSMGVDYFSGGTAINRTIPSNKNYLLPAACLFISADFVNECFIKFGWFFIAIFDSYVEDIELSLRALLMKKGVLLLPEELVFHERSTTSVVDRVSFLSARNHIWTIFTTWTPVMIYKNIAEIMKYQIISNIIYFLKFRYIYMLLIYLQTLLNLPRLLKIRRKIQPNLSADFPENIFLKNSTSLYIHIKRSRTYNRIQKFLTHTGI